MYRSVIFDVRTVNIDCEIPQDSRILWFLKSGYHRSMEPYDENIKNRLTLHNPVLQSLTVAYISSGLGQLLSIVQPSTLVPLAYVSEMNFDPG